MAINENIMHYVYILKQKDKDHFYVGLTNDITRRLAEHKNNKNLSTRGRDWELHCYFCFKNRKIASKFEDYLKTGSGRAFSKKHFEFKIDEALA